MGHPFDVDFKTEDVKYIAINIGDLRSDKTVKKDGDWLKFRRCTGEYDILPMTEDGVKCLLECISPADLTDYRIFDAKKFRDWVYGQRKTAPEVLNWKLREKYTLPKWEK